MVQLTLTHLTIPHLEVILFMISTAVGFILMCISHFGIPSLMNLSLTSISQHSTLIFKSFSLLIPPSRFRSLKITHHYHLTHNDANFFNCTHSESDKQLVVPITAQDEVSFTNKFSLIATINHSGTLNSGHCWAFIKDLHSSSWDSCNDKLVFNVEENSLNDTTSHILFYIKV